MGRAGNIDLGPVKNVGQLLPLILHFEGKLCVGNVSRMIVKRIRRGDLPTR